ncbi:MAG TPA: DUF2294 domain-containing protein [Thermoleophilaceae bacterium]|nr:DUF2294 domain-containing protein [Thermoleophilaceae bacterium]
MTELDLRTRGQVAAEITNGIVKLFSEYYGRGPVKAKTFVFENYTMTVLEDTLTTSESTLVEAGREEIVREFRLSFQSEMCESFHAVVEHATGCKVVTYQSQIAFNPDACFEIFVLDRPPTIAEDGQD